MPEQETDPLLGVFDPYFRFVGSTPESQHKLMLRYIELIERRWLFELNKLWDEQEES